MAWRVAAAVLALHAQLKREVPRAAPPATAATSWGTIGDTSHTSTSDHSPKDFPGWGNDIVTAGDIPDRADLGLDARAVLDNIRRSHDPRVKYGISRGQMFSSYTSGGVPPWTWRPYTGSDGHFTHGHLSVVGDARADGGQSWATGLGEVLVVAEFMADENAAALAWRVDAMSSGSVNVRSGPQSGEPMFVVAALKRLETAVTALVETISTVTAPEGGAPFTDAQLAQLRELIESTEDS